MTFRPMEICGLGTKLIVPCESGHRRDETDCTTGSDFPCPMNTFLLCEPSLRNCGDREGHINDSAAFARRNTTHALRLVVHWQPARKADHAAELDVGDASVERVT